MDLNTRVGRMDSPYLLVEIALLKLTEMDSSVKIETLLKQFKSRGNVTSHSVQPPPAVPENKIREPKTIQSIAEDKKIPEKEAPQITLPVTKEDKITETVEVPVAATELGNPEPSDPPKAETSQAKSEPASELFSYWQDFLARLHSKRPSLGTLLDQGDLISFSEGLAVIELVDPGSFPLTMLNNHKKYLETVLSEIVGRKTHINFKTIPQTGTKTRKRSTPSGRQSSEDTLNKIIELFDGEIER